MRTWSRWRSSTSLWTASSTPAGIPCASAPPTTVVGAPASESARSLTANKNSTPERWRDARVGVRIWRCGQGFRLLFVVCAVFCRHRSTHPCGCTRQDGLTGVTTVSEPPPPPQPSPPQPPQQPQPPPPPPPPTPPGVSAQAFPSFVA